MSIPYLVVTAAFVPLLLYLLFTRGNPLLRGPLLGVAVCAMPWAAGMTAVTSCADPTVAHDLWRSLLAPVPLVGPAIFAFVLGLSEQLTRYRRVVAISILVGVACGVASVATDLMIDGVWQTSGGLWMGHAGPLMPVAIASLVGWPVIGLVIGARASRRDTEHAQRRYRVFIALTAAVVLSASDTLLLYGVGEMPLSWVPGGFGVGYVLVALLTADLIRARGPDWATAIELGVVGVVGGTAALIAGQETSALLGVGALLPVFAAGQLGVVALRERARDETELLDRDLELAVDDFTNAWSEMRSERDILDQLEPLLGDRFGLANPKLYIASDAPAAWRLAGDAEDAPMLPVDARVRAWLLANREPLLAEHMATRRLGGLRGPIEAFWRQCGAECVVPLVDRAALAGAIVTGGRRDELALRDAEVDALRRVQQATARALTYMRLYREAEQRAEVAREVEVAAAVEDARAPAADHLELRRCTIASYYRAATRFGGDWWDTYEWPDGRVLVVVGDVTGSGVPAALLTATASGSCGTVHRLLSADVDPGAVLELLDDTVRDVGGVRYSMTCFAAVFDFDAGVVRFANAGHPFPYLCRATGELSALVARGTPLGVRGTVVSTGEVAISPGDLVVLYSNAVTDCRDAGGRPYGDRRFQRSMRAWTGRDSRRVCHGLAQDANAHYGEHPIDDDVLLVVVGVSWPD